jgi:hypothetical protein
MEIVPKIARQRMLVADLSGTGLRRVHPEAEVLTAFAEQSLAECERAQVFDHLAQCGDCRDVLFLAAPRTEPIQELQNIPPRGSWLRWPALRWATLGACVVVAGAAVMFRYEAKESQTASHQEAAAPVIIAKETAPVVSEDNLATRADIKVPEPKRPELNDRVGGKLSTTTEPARHTSSAVPKFPMQFDGPAVANPSALSEGSASKSELPLGARLAKNGNQSLKQDSKTQEQKDELDYLNPDDKVAGANTSSASTAQLGGTASKAKNESAAAAPAAASQGEVVAERADLFPRATAPRWMLTSAGTLQRSFDQGHTWETISVASNVLFHALSVQGAEIWVGGPAGALYHSTNSGQHWIQVVPTSNGEFLNAEITQIEFVGQQNGTLTTSSGQRWVTFDSGKTWQKK